MLEGRRREGEERGEGKGRPKKTTQTFP